LIKLLNKSRFLIPFFLVLLFSFTFIFHNFGERITSNNDPISQKDFSIKSHEQQRLFLEEKKNKTLDLRLGHDREKGRILVKTTGIETECTNCCFSYCNKYFTRWVVAHLEGKIIETFQKNLSPKIAFISYCFYLAFLFSLSFLLSVLSIEIITKQKNFKSSLLCSTVFIFYLYPLYFQAAEEYSIREMLAISGCIYFSLKKNLGLYLVFAVFGVLNKETGLLLMIIYPLINYEKKFYFIPVLVLPSVFLLFNYDLVLQKEFYNLNTWFITAAQKERSFLNFYGDLYFYSLLKIIIYVLPTLLLLFFTKTEKNLKLLVFIFFVYFASLFFGIPITNLYAYITLSPLMLLINSYAFKKIKGN